MTPPAMEATPSAGEHIVRSTQGEEHFEADADTTPPAMKSTPSAREQVKEHVEDLTADSDMTPATLEAMPCDECVVGGTAGAKADERSSRTSGTIKVTSEVDSMPQYVQLLVKGNAVCGDSRSPMARPDWLDTEKLKRGQRFALKYTFGVMYAELLSLMILFTLDSGLKSLIFTSNSHTPFKAFKRYLSTVLRVRSWYEHDLWDENLLGHRNLRTVRRMHENVRRRMEAMPAQELAEKVTLDVGSTPMWTDLYDEVREDFRASCPVMRAPLASAVSIPVSQTDMAVTQFGFIGLVLLFPRMFGIHGATDEDLDSFAHLWRCIGYCLGIDDRYNLCAGDLATVRQRCADIVRFWALPSFAKVNRDWIHMSRCLVEGISYYVAGTTFQVTLLYLCRVLTIDAPKLYASMSLLQKFIYYYTVFLFTCLLRMPGMQAAHNWLINLSLKNGQNKKPETLKKLEARMYPYEEMPGVVLSTRL